MTLTLETLKQGVDDLIAVDPDLKRIYLETGLPPLWNREPGFATLVAIILEQQVSLASARAAFLKLQDAIQPVTPVCFLTLSDGSLKAIGFSRQKTSYCRGLAQAILDLELDLEGLGDLDDRSVRLELVKIKGIGSWTADIYLLMALLRPDIWPAGDLALVAAVSRVKGLSSKPTPDEWEQLSLPWRPWRAVAARLFWSYYLANLNLS